MSETHRGFWRSSLLDVFPNLRRIGFIIPTHLQDAHKLEHLKDFEIAAMALPKFDDFLALKEELKAIRRRKLALTMVVSIKDPEKPDYVRFFRYTIEGRPFVRDILR